MGTNEDHADRCQRGEMENILQRKYWVFDLDGTLTLPVHDFAVIRAALGVPATADILGHLASLPEAAAQPLHERLDDMERELVARTGPASGAIALVELLCRRNCRIGILTRNTRHIALLTLERIGLARFFRRENILGRGEALPKPDPDGIHKLAQLWETSPENLIMVGDYLYDLQAGQAAGAATVHVHGDLERRWPEWTDLCVLSLQELADLVSDAGQPE